MARAWDFWDDDPSSEDESDASTLSLEKLRSAVVTGSDWTVETLLSQLRKGNIELNPAFQRRAVWDEVRQSTFVESVLMNLPIPQIVLAERKGQINRYIVLDGKQRLLTLARFAATPTTHGGFEPLLLRGLTILKDYNGESLETMMDAGSFDDAIAAFDNHTIRTVVIRNWPDDDFLYRVFLRLNTGSVRLSPQELRQALEPGAFVTFADAAAAESETLHRALGIAGPDFRMRDTEVLVRYYAFRNFAPDYRGNLKQFLDQTCAVLNRRWEEDESAIRRQLRDLERSILVTEDIFGEDEAFSRFRNDKYEGRFNRAIFDVMTFYFTRSKVANAAQQNADRVMGAFEELCVEDAEFDRAISATTKSLRATAYRFTRWAEMLSTVVGFRVSPPANYESYL